MRASSQKRTEFEAFNYGLGRLFVCKRGGHIVDLENDVDVEALLMFWTLLLRVIQMTCFHDSN